MSEKSGLPRARIARNYFTWGLWLLPVAAAGVCAFFLLHDFVFTGPTITIYFQSVDGLEEQNSPVMYRGVKIGQVESLRLTKGEDGVAARAKLDDSAGDVARQGSIFWIVRPELRLGSISGLRTIVSGSYITVQPGTGERTNLFAGAEQAPLAPIKAVQFEFLTDDLGSLEAQSPIFYRGIQVGEVTAFHLADDSSAVRVEGRVREEYAPLVRVNSKFWNAGGINVHAGLFSGLQISAESAQTVVSGGIAFATPPDYGPAATNGTVFVLNKQETDDWKTWNATILLRAVPAVSKEKNTLPQLNQ